MNRQAIGMRKQLAGLLVMSGIALVLAIGCEDRTQGVTQSGAIQMAQSSPIDSTAILEKVALEQAIAATQPSTAPVGPTSGAISFSSKDVRKYTPDPEEVGLKDIARAKQVKLSLQDCVARALANNFKIKTEGYGPAISATDILQAESVFDAVYFLDTSYQKTDQPPITRNSKLISYNPGESDSRVLRSGLRKALPTGATLSGTYNLNRTDNSSLQLAKLDPIFNSDFLVELRQPILKGFGIDYNRSQIESAKNNQKIAKYKYRRNVRDVLADVEKAYWQLVQARRDVVIQQTLVKQTEETNDLIIRRKDYDVYSVQVTRVSALLGTRRAQYIQIKNQVKDAEDQLKALMNDPELNLGEDIEIIPTDFPTLGPLVVDRIVEVQAALECRSEIQEAKLQIENERINVAVAKNQALPRFDMVFQYTIHGTSDNPGNSFDQMTTSNYQDYAVGLSFEYPIGNRGPRSALKKAILQRDQVIAALKQVIENVILEVDVAVRNLQTAYYQVPPSREAVQAAEENVQAVIARMTRLSPEYLDVQLSAQETTANARRSLLTALVNYNIAMVQLERAKDTLFRYNNVTIQAAGQEN